MRCGGTARDAARRDRRVARAYSTRWRLGSGAGRREASPTPEASRERLDGPPRLRQNADCGRA